MVSEISMTAFCKRSGFVQRFLSFIRRVRDRAYIIVTEAFAVFWHVLPCAISWWIREKFGKKIRACSLPFIIGQTRSTAKLFLYAPLDLKNDKTCVPVLFLHGDYGHPYTLHHLGKIALKNHPGPVFTLYMPNMSKQSHFAEQASFINNVIGHIRKMVENEGGTFEGILAVGHSKGAMLLVERQFSAENPSEILRTFAVGGALRNEENCFQGPLRATFDQLHQQIEKHSDRTFFQVIPKKDWSAPYKAMAVRPHEHCYSVPGMHLSGLYSKETKFLFKQFLEMPL